MPPWIPIEERGRCEGREKHEEILDRNSSDEDCEKSKYQIHNDVIDENSLEESAHL